MNDPIPLPLPISVIKLANHFTWITATLGTRLPSTCEERWISLVEPFRL